MDTKPLYVSFFKTGTSTISSVLKDKIITFGHQIPNDIKYDFENKESFITIRNPIDWYISMYQFKTMSVTPPKDFGIMDNNSFQDFINDFVFCNNIEKWEKPWKNVTRQRLFKKYVIGKKIKIGYFTFAFIMYIFKNPEDILKQDDILDYLKKNFNKKCVKHIIKLENLDEDYNKLVKNFNYPETKVNFPVTNKSIKKNINKNEYKYLIELDKFIYDNFYPEYPS